MCQSHKKNSAYKAAKFEAKAINKVFGQDVARIGRDGKSVETDSVAMSVAEAWAFRQGILAAQSVLGVNIKSFVAVQDALAAAFAAQAEADRKMAEAANLARGGR